jgi:hypothetical protein
MILLWQRLAVLLAVRHSLSFWERVRVRACGRIDPP